MVRRTLVIGSLLAGLAVAAPAAGASAPARPAQAYSIDQAISDQAQRNTIAFSGLAFLSGNVGADTFPQVLRLLDLAECSRPDRQDDDVP